MGHARSAAVCSTEWDQKQWNIYCHTGSWHSPLCSPNTDIYCGGMCTTWHDIKRHFHDSLAHKNSTLQVFLTDWLSCYSQSLVGAHRITSLADIQPLNPLTPELSQHGVPRPRAPRHNVICNGFFFKISQPIFRLYGNKSKTCRAVFRPEKVRVLTPSMPAVPNCCCSKGSVPYWSNPPFLIFDIRALWRSVLSVRAPKCQKLKMVG